VSIHIHPTLTGGGGVEADQHQHHERKRQQDDVAGCVGLTHSVGLRVAMSE